MSLLMPVIENNTGLYYPIFHKHDAACIYRSNCLDGFASAYAVHCFSLKYDIHTTFHKGIYGKEPPKFPKKSILYIVGFSYPLEIINDLAKKAYYIFIIDHNKTANENLGNVPLPDNVTFIYDESKSGCTLTWKTLFPNPNLYAPFIFKHIEDRDLWKFNLPDTKAVTQFLYARNFDFKVWDVICSYSQYDIKVEGNILQRKFDQEVNTIVTNYRYKLFNLNNYEVPIINVQSQYVSEVLNILAENFPFAIGYYITEDKIIFSLRSTQEGIDVSEIAKQYGGGGHKHAAGFSLPFSITSILNNLLN